MNNNFEQFAKQIRYHILRAILKSKAAHIACAMSMVDILAVLYGGGYVLPDRPQFFLSKGHGGLAVYSTLRAIDVISEELFQTYHENGSYLNGHISHKHVPGIYLTTGSLGGGIAVANGMALANRIDNLAFENIYVIVGDGECAEGSIWESVLFANHHKLNEVTVIIDRNRLQACGTDKEILDLGDISEKFAGFGWDTITVNGHDFTQLKHALDWKTDKPKCIVANTIKGKGVKFMENDNLWHYRHIKENDYKIALSELGLADYE